MSRATLHQCRMELTMFFPTPKVTEAFSDENMVGSSVTASTPFFSHVYRNGKVWCPEKEGFVRYESVLGSAIREIVHITYCTINSRKKQQVFREARLGNLTRGYKRDGMLRSGDRFYRLRAFSARPSAIACSIFACASSSLTAGTFPIFYPTLRSLFLVV